MCIKQCMKDREVQSRHIGDTIPRNRIGIGVGMWEALE